MVLLVESASDMLPELGGIVQGAASSLGKEGGGGR